MARVVRLLEVESYTRSHAGVLMATPTPTATGSPSVRASCAWGHAHDRRSTDGTNVYVYGGGNDAGGYYNDLWRWDPTTGTWTQLANMPTAKQNIQGAYSGTAKYVPGGFKRRSYYGRTPS